MNMDWIFEDSLKTWTQVFYKIELMGVLMDSNYNEPMMVEMYDLHW